MKALFLVFSLIFSYTYQLTCDYNCRESRIDNFYFDHRQLNFTRCERDSHAIRCHGRIMIYYEKKQIISYSLGSKGHIIEKEIEELAIKNNFKLLIYFLFLTDSFSDKELVLSVYIICQTDDNCALNYVENLINLYYQRRNPMDELSKLLYADDEEFKLICYNSEIQNDEDCLLDQYSTCIINKTDLFEQRCHKEFNPRLEYVSMITLLEKYSLIKILELIICNLDNCNRDITAKYVDNIVYNYTLFGLNITFNHSNQLKCYLIYLFIFTYVVDLF